MIDDEELSIVVQGPILTKSAFDITDEVTKLVCLRIKKLFPKCELILSTWEGQNVKNIQHDKLVVSVDPGATWFNYEDYELLNNCNRLIVSTKAGIEAATRKYVLKLRSDLFVVSKDFLAYFYKFTSFDEQYKFVKNRIIGFSLYSIKGHRNCLFTMKRPFHISDWAYFGYKEDLFDLYDIPLTTEPAFSQWFLHRCKPFFDIEPGRLWKMPPEQYVTLSFLQKHTALTFEHTTDISNNNVEISARLLSNNFLILDQTQFFLISLKYMNFQLLFKPLLSRTAIFYSTWLQDYYHYCQVAFSPKKIRDKIQIVLRSIIYRSLNFILRSHEEKVGRLVGRFIKKWYDNNK